MKNKLTATEQFQKDLMLLLQKYHSDQLSENVKRALKNKGRLLIKDNVVM